MKNRMKVFRNAGDFFSSVDNSNFRSDRINLIFHDKIKCNEKFEFF